MFEEHFDFEVSLHPRNRKDKRPTTYGILDCDYVISDFGTMVYEAWALGKPVIFPALADRRPDQAAISASRPRRSSSTSGWDCTPTAPSRWSIS